MSVGHDSCGTAWRDRHARSVTLHKKENLPSFARSLTLEALQIGLESLALAPSSRSRSPRGLDRRRFGRGSPLGSSARGHDGGIIVLAAGDGIVEILDVALGPRGVEVGHPPPFIGVIAADPDRTGVIRVGDALGAIDQAANLVRAPGTFFCEVKLTWKLSGKV